MDFNRRNSIVWIIVLLVEALILKLAKSIRLWIYIALPIIAGFAFTEFYKPKPPVKKRNLR
ncbi:MAG: hypothetical protein K0R84_2182 [Clostridia bacterium]|nr:hypothetical protein [Clostridia bacterium]